MQFLQPLKASVRQLLKSSAALQGCWESAGRGRHPDWEEEHGVGMGKAALELWECPPLPMSRAGEDTGGVSCCACRGLQSGAPELQMLNCSHWHRLHPLEGQLGSWEVSSRH